MQNFNAVGIIGDVHTENEHLHTSLDYLNKMNIDSIICTGDIADGKGDLNQCCSKLAKSSVTTVIGNHDRWLLNNEMRTLPEANALDELSIESKIFLEGLPAEYEFSLNGLPVLLCHGVGRNDMSKINKDDFGYALDVNEDLQAILRERRIKLLVNGHSHKRMVKQIEGLTVINAGTIKFEHFPCIAILESKPLQVRFFSILENGQIQESEIVGI